ncbi:hypothetical protein C8F01DRAFT_981050, partial [Mycena amicta]
RIIHDPRNEICPDFESDAFKEVRATMGAQHDNDKVIALKKGWMLAHAGRVHAWEDQCAADEREARTAAEKLRAEKEIADAEAARKAEDERLEAEKKKPKLGDFDANSAPPETIETRVSAVAARAIKQMQYCPLYAFTPEGLREARDAVLSSANDDMSAIHIVSSADNQLAFQMGPPSSGHKNVRRDESLTWAELTLASARYLREISAAGWKNEHVEALTQFFYLVEHHPLREEDAEHGAKILLIYQDRVRYEWFKALGTERAFNIGIMSDVLLKKYADEYFRKLQADAVKRCVFPVNLLNPSLTFVARSSSFTFPILSNLSMPCYSSIPSRVAFLSMARDAHSRAAFYLWPCLAPTHAPPFYLWPCCDSNSIQPAR